MRVNERRNLQTEIRKIIDGFKRRLSHIEDAKDVINLKNKELKPRNRNLPGENQVGFTEYVEMQKEENEIDVGLFFGLAEENKIINNQVAVNTLIEEMEKFKNDFFTNG